MAGASCRLAHPCAWRHQLSPASGRHTATRTPLQCPDTTAGAGARPVPRHNTALETAGKPQMAHRRRQQSAPSCFAAARTLATQSTVGCTWARVGKTPQCPTFGPDTGVTAVAAVAALGGSHDRVPLDYFWQQTFGAFRTSSGAATDGYLMLMNAGAP